MSRKFYSIRVKSLPEAKTNANWLIEEFVDCLGILFLSGFSVRAIVCDNYPSNVSSFKNYNQDPDELFILYEPRRIYLFYDAIHLVKDIRNNLSHYIQLIFLSFKFDGFKDLSSVPGGEM